MLELRVRRGRWWLLERGVTQINFTGPHSGHHYVVQQVEVCVFPPQGQEDSDALIDILHV